MDNERNYEEEIARRDREELEQIESEKYLSDISRDSIQLDLEDISIEIFELMEKIERVKKMEGLDENTKNHAVSGFERRLEEAKHAKETMEEALSNVHKNKNALEIKEQQNRNRQEATKRYEERKKEIEADRQKKIDLASASLETESERLKYRESLLQFIKSNPDAFKTYIRTHDLDAVSEKYGAEFDQFLKDNEKVEPITTEENTETESDAVVEMAQDDLSDDFKVVDEPRDKDTLVTGLDISQEELAEESKKESEEKPEDLLAGMSFVSKDDDPDKEKPEDLLPKGVSVGVEDSEVTTDYSVEDGEPTIDIEVEERKKVSVIETAKGLIKELVETKHGRAIAALLAIGGAVSVVATGPVAFTALGTIASGLGSAAFIGGGSALAAHKAQQYENKGTSR